MIPGTGTVLKHVEALTRHVDANLLNISTLTSLAKLLNLEEVRFHDVIQHKGRLHTALAAWTIGGEVKCNSEFPLENELVAADGDVALLRCLSDESAATMEMQAGEKYRYFMPVRIDDRPIAYFEICSARPLTRQQMDISEGVLGVYRNYFGLLKDSQHDTLTGLLNRKTFDRGLLNVLALTEYEAQQERAGKLERRVTRGGNHWLAVVDIDHFKRINDEFGHIYGDEVLILMANLMRRSFRQHDKLYRFGGEEFVIIMHYSDFDDTEKSLQRFRNTVANHGFPQVGKVTVSIGFAPILSMQLATMVLGNADEALYYAKSNGRDQVCCYTTLVDSGAIAAKKLHSDAELF